MLVFPFLPPLSLLVSVSLWTDGQLYAGVYIDFMGTDSAIFRTLGKHTAMRTDQYNSRWLNGMHITHRDTQLKNANMLLF